MYTYDLDRIIDTTTDTIMRITRLPWNARQTKSIKRLRSSELKRRALAVRRLEVLYNKHYPSNNVQERWIGRAEVVSGWIHSLGHCCRKQLLSLQTHSVHVLNLLNGSFRILHEKFYTNLAAMSSLIYEQFSLALHEI